MHLELQNTLRNEKRRKEKKRKCPIEEEEETKNNIGGMNFNSVHFCSSN